MQINFAIVTAGVWQCAERPEIQVRNVRVHQVLAGQARGSGWAVFVNGIELLTAGRNRTMRDAAAAAESYVNRQAQIEAAPQFPQIRRVPAAALAPAPAPIREALDRVSIAAREAVEAAIVAANDRPAEPDPSTEDDVDELIDRVVRRAQYLALRAVRRTLTACIEEAEAECGADGHGPASSHDDNILCGRRFDVEEFVGMLNHTATVILKLPVVVDK